MVVDNIHFCKVMYFIALKHCFCQSTKQKLNAFIISLMHSILVLQIWFLMVHSDAQILLELSGSIDPKAFRNGKSF